MPGNFPARGAGGFRRLAVPDRSPVPVPATRTSAAVIRFRSAGIAALVPQDGNIP
ncbi:MAG: hypothetical protein WBH14_16860 [Albidovulum sp.]